MEHKDVLSLSSFETIDEILNTFEDKKNLKVLDVGCGCGNTVNYLKEKNIDTIGIDSAENIINLGKEKYEEINIKIMDANNLQFKDKSFDFILFECSLSVMGNLEKILLDARNLLKDNGVILLSDFYVKESKEDECFYTINYWMEIFKKLNFQIVHFKDRSKEWRNYIGMILWEYGDLCKLFRGNQNKNITKNILKKQTGYFLVILKKD